MKELIKENPKITQKEMSEATSVPLRTLKREIARMQEDGELQREGTNRTGKWILK